MKVYLDNKGKHMVWRSYNRHPPVAYVSRKEARLCHFIGDVPKDNNKPFIKEIQHVLFTAGLSRNYVAMLKQAPRVERQFRSDNCKAIFCPADSILRQLTDHIDTAGMEDKLHIVLPAYPDQADHVYEHAGPFTILTISNKFWGRGIPLAIEVFRKLRKKHGKAVRMKLVCDDVPTSHPTVAGLEIIRARRISRQLKNRLYREADVFLLLSLMQFGVVLETMAHGIPTVSTPNGDKGGWILPGDTGFIVKPPFFHYDAGFGITWKTWNQFQSIVKARFEHGDLAYMVTEAADHVEFLMNNPDGRKQMGQAAQKQQREKHSFKPRNEQVRQIYADILKGMS